MAAISDKLYFKIGEVARLAGVEPHVLRYWETEFREIAPIKSRSQQRLYRRRDVEKILLVKNLLYQEGYTLSGARRRLREMSRNGKPLPPPSQLPISFIEKERRERAVLNEIRGELKELLNDLKTLDSRSGT